MNQKPLRRTRCVCEWPCYGCAECDPDLVRCRAEQRSAAAQLSAGGCDRRGLTQCIEDWYMEEAILLAFAKEKTCRKS